MWHVVAGRELWATWQFAGPDQLATFSQLSFVYHQWLPELAMAGMEAVGGLPGVAWLFHLMLLGFFVATVCPLPLASGHPGRRTGQRRRLGRGRRQPEPPPTGDRLHPVGDLARRLAANREGRPAALVARAAHLSVGLRARDLALCSGLGGSLRGRPAAGSPPRSRPSLRIGLFIAALVLVALVTPVGPRLLLAPFAVSQVSPFIMEWRPTPITDPSAAATLLMGLVVMLVWLRSKERVSWTHLLLWLFAMGSTLMYARTIAVGAILVAPLFAAALQRAVPRRPIPRRAERRTLAVASLASLLLAAVFVPGTASVPGKVPSQLRCIPLGHAAGHRGLER